MMYHTKPGQHNAMFHVLKVWLDRQQQNQLIFFTHRERGGGPRGVAAGEGGGTDLMVGWCWVGVSWPGTAAWE